MTAEVADARHLQSVTVSQVFGEIVWLLGQSQKHLHLAVHDMNWLVMPAIQRRQFHVFREGKRPVGAALWALLDDAGERKLTCGLHVTQAKLEEGEWGAGDRLWLIEFVTPFATQENRQAEVMMADLVTGRLANRSFNMLRTDPENGDVQVISVSADSGSKLVREVKEKLGGFMTCP